MILGDGPALENIAVDASQQLVPAGRVIEHYDALQTQQATPKPTRFEYDRLGRLVKQTDLLDNVTSYEYDLAGNQVAVNQPLDRRSETDYDVLGRVTERRPYSGTITQYTYEAHGNVLREKDALLVWETTFTYDGLDLRTSSVNAEGGVTQYEYDANGNRTALRDPEDNTTTWTYDGLNRVVEERNERDMSRVFTYDPNGAWMLAQDREERRIKYLYDKAGRLVEEQWPDAEDHVVGGTSFQYDLADRLEVVENAYAKYEFTYRDFRHAYFARAGDGKLRRVGEWRGELTSGDGGVRCRVGLRNHGARAPEGRGSGQERPKQRVPSAL